MLLLVKYRVSSYLSLLLSVWK